MRDIVWKPSVTSSETTHLQGRLQHPNASQRIPKHPKAFQSVLYLVDSHPKDITMTNSHSDNSPRAPLMINIQSSTVPLFKFELNSNRKNFFRFFHFYSSSSSLFIFCITDFHRLSSK